MTSWRDFFDFVETVVFPIDHPTERAIIWRGQRDERWLLESTLDRLFKNIGTPASLTQDELERRARHLLESFQHASRGLRGNNPAKLELIEWWALGQHYGLATPLLDWTKSPFAALYFAFEEPPPKDQGGVRIVFALDQDLVNAENAKIAEAPDIEGRPPTLSFIDPLADDNPRLISQGGVLTQAPVGVPVERWIRDHCKDPERPALMRIEIPDSDRLSALLALDRMNINHLSLFPDLSGASRCINLRTELRARRLP